jgi:hypothetical protein
MAEQLKKINIDGTEYNFDELSKEAKAELHAVRVADAELKRLNMQLALTQTARNAYVQALKALLTQKED